MSLGYKSSPPSVLQFPVGDHGRSFPGEEVAGVYSFPCFTKDFISCFNEEMRQ